MEGLGIAIGGGTVSEPLSDRPRLAAIAEDLGYGSVWMPEGRQGDQFSILTACAVATSRIALGTNISSIFVRTAPLIAMAAQTVDRFSNGRMVLGLGTDHQSQVVNMHGHEYTNAIPRMRETVEIIRALIRDGVVSHQGEIFSIDRFDMYMGEGRNDMKILLGAVNPKMLGIAGEIGDGAIVVNHTVTSIREAAGRVTAGATDADRNGQAPTIAAMIPTLVDDDQDLARELMRRHLVSMGHRVPRYIALKHKLGWGNEWEHMIDVKEAEGPEAAARVISDGYIDAFTICGSPAHARERIAEWGGAGVDHPILVLAGDQPRRLETLDALGPVG